NGCRSDGRHGFGYLSFGSDYYCESQGSEYSLSRGEEDLKMTTVDKSSSQLSSMRDGSLPKQAHSPSRQMISTGSGAGLVSSVKALELPLALPSKTSDYRM